MFAAGGCVERMTTPTGTAPAEAPARGAMVGEDCWFSRISQFCGRPILRAPRSAVSKLGLGCTVVIETAGMLAALAPAVAGEAGTTAPFFLFSAAHWPFFAPSAISFASYARTPPACFRTLTNCALLPEYFWLGQSLISV